jgi:hypothetical protein
MRSQIVRLFALVLLVGQPFAAAEVTRIEITSRQPYAGGKQFGETGAYERIRGRISFEVDPQAESNATIVDLELAPRNVAGRVEFAADLEILAPQDLTQANGAILYDVNNRGNRVCLGQFNGGGAEGFLMRKGFIVVWSGWIAEVLPGNDRLILDAPIATNSGEPIVGPILAEFVPTADTDKHTIAHFKNQGSFRPTERGLAESVLTWRLRQSDPRVVVPRRQWKLHRREVEVDGRRGALPLIEIELSGGIRAGYIYELTYEGQGPFVQGLGLAGIRDLISHLKHDRGDQNPLRVDGEPAAKFAYGFGVSQSGRCLRTFLYDGFNADERGRQVFDGIIPHVAGAGMGFFNHRFASPTRHNTQHDNHLYPADVFPFTYGPEKDAFTSRVDSLLKRAVESKTVPKVMHTQSSSEYWHRAGSLVHTDPASERDSLVPPDVRIYTFGGTQHGAGTGVPRPGGDGQLMRNPTDYRPFVRALLIALDRWVRTGEEPPPSVYPKISDNSLVDWKLGASGWKGLPGVRYPGVIHQPDFLDRGSEFLTKRRISRVPPFVLGTYKVRVPAFGPDNNELGCLMLPSVAVPVATYTSWNLRHRSIGAETELLSLAGGFILFSRSETERRTTGDPRLSIQERYQDVDDYQAQFIDHAEQLVEAGYVLPEDLPRLEELAAAVFASGGTRGEQ